MFGFSCCSSSAFSRKLVVMILFDLYQPKLKILRGNGKVVARMDGGGRIKQLEKRCDFGEGIRMIEIGWCILPNGFIFMVHGQWCSYKIDQIIVGLIVISLVHSRLCHVAQYFGQISSRYKMCNLDEEAAIA